MSWLEKLQQFITGGQPQGGPMQGDYMPEDILKKARAQGPTYTPWQGDQPPPAPSMSPGEGNFHTASGNMDTATPPVGSGGKPSLLSKVAPSMSDEGPTVDHSRADMLQSKLQPTSGWRGMLPKVALMAAPLAIGAAVGKGKGLAMAAANEVEGYAKGKMQARDTLNKQLEDELNRENTHQIEADRTKATMETMKPYRDAQASRLATESDADTARAAHYRSMDAHPKMQAAEQYAKAFQKAIEENRDPEADPDVVHWKNMINATKPQSPDTQTPLTDAAGNVTGSFHTKSGQISEVNNPLKMRKGPVPPPSFTPLPDATGGIGGAFNNRNATVKPVDTSAAPTARKTPIPAAIERQNVQAHTTDDSYNKLVPLIDKYASKIGPGAGRVNTWKALLTGADPQFQELRGAVIGHLSLQPALHNMRTNQMVKHLEETLGSPTFTAESLKGGLKGLSNVSSSVQQGIKDVYGNQTTSGVAKDRDGNTYKAGQVVDGYKLIDATKPHDPASWQKVDVKGGKKLTDKVAQ